MATFTRGTSASEICALTVIVSSRASLMMVGDICTAFTVCPCSVTMATPLPSIRASTCA